MSASPDLAGRRILLAVTGGIAAYKTPMLVRLLLERGAQVRVMRTESAAQFVTDTTLSVLSHHPVASDLFAPTEEFPVLHVGLAEWAELVLVAPATANTLAKLANGLADDLVGCVCLATTAPVMVAPAMEQHMLEHPGTQQNARLLLERGVGWIEPETGPLASGASGKGRMADIETIADAVGAHLSKAGDLAGRRVLVTAGPTLEDVDPVRFIGNRSSGKMGYALADRARRRGARVTLVSGPTSLPAPEGIDFIPVRSALQMLEACERVFDDVDVAVMAAAVADYRPAQAATTKMKRGDGPVTIELVANPDIAATLGARKQHRLVVAFALETGAGVEAAESKRVKKGADFIVLNDLTDEGAGFEVDTNVVSFVDDGGARKLPRLAKADVADRILDEIARRLTA